MTAQVCVMMPFTQGDHPEHVYVGVQATAKADVVFVATFDIDESLPASSVVINAKKYVVEGCKFVTV